MIGLQNYKSSGWECNMIDVKTPNKFLNVGQYQFPIKLLTSISLKQQLNSIGFGPVYINVDIDSCLSAYAHVFVYIKIYMRTNMNKTTFINQFL